MKDIITIIVVVIIIIIIGIIIIVIFVKVTWHMLNVNEVHCMWPLILRLIPTFVINFRAISSQLSCT